MPPAHQPNNPAKIAVIGTYVPRRCGIATFSADLLNAMSKDAPDTELWAVAMNDIPVGYDYRAEVQFEIGQRIVADYRSAVDFLNMNGVDAVSLQHEFGIYGGKAGSNVVRLLQSLRMPVVSTLHTVLEQPDRDQEQVIRAIGSLSDRVVVMSAHAALILHKVYGVAPGRIAIIPHGVPDMPFLDSSYHKEEYGMIGKKVILTFGLMSRGKGYEYVIAALPKIVDAHPDAVFVVIGETHPSVKREEGEAYRDSLKRRAEELGVGENVVFHDQFLATGALTDFLSTADICVTPYLNRDQIVSGVLSYALGAGKAIVSTGFRYAEEMLADGRGRLVPFRDSEAIATQIIDLLSNDAERQAMRKQAYTFARNMVWSDVGAQYLGLFREARLERVARPRIHQVRTLQSAELALLPPRFDHLRTLTDDTGILQHARFNVPDRNHGYCTDDNARALIVAMLSQKVVSASDSLLPLAYRYLGFLQHAFNPEAGRFRNFMGYDRHWQEAIGSEDAHGRALWALGQTVLDTPSPGMAGAAMTLFEQSLPALTILSSPRAWAFALLGLDACLRRFSGASDARRIRAELAERLLSTLKGNATSTWPWLEDTITYANGVIPHALVVSGGALKQPDMVDAGIGSLRWLMDIQRDARGHFVPIGNDGWFVRDGSPARFDQQPIEAQHMMDALLEVYRLTGEEHWREDARCCFEWFLGRNDLQQAIADDATGACSDGLHPDGINQNQGAESSLAWLHASLRLSIALGRSASKNRMSAGDIDRLAQHPAPPATIRSIGITH
jgi:glycosyltransferase involved in cell wall biosynthesis